MLYSVLFRFGHIRRSNQCAVYILYSKISTDPGLPKIRHSHRFVAVVIQFSIRQPAYENKRPDQLIKDVLLTVWTENQIHSGRSRL